MPAAQVRAALAVRLPRAERTERQAPKALSAGQYEWLVPEAKARIADDPLAGARDLALMRVLGDAGRRCEELARLERRDFLPARKGARLRALDVRHGQSHRPERVTLRRGSRISAGEPNGRARRRRDGGHQSGQGHDLPRRSLIRAGQHRDPQRGYGDSTADRRMGRELRRYLQRNAGGSYWLSQVRGIVVDRKVIAVATRLRRTPGGRRTACGLCGLIQGSDVADFTPGHTILGRGDVVLRTCRTRPE